MSSYKLIIETSDYIEKFTKSLGVHLYFGILKFESNKERHTESSIDRLTENDLKTLIETKRGGSKQQIYNVNKRKGSDFNIYKKIKNPDIQSLDKLEGFIIKHRNEIEKIEKK